MSPSLPDTVLEEIFNYYAPVDPFTNDDDDFPAFGDYEPRMAFSHAKPLLACLVVCKSWSLVAVRVLYRAIRVDSMYVFKGLLSTLEPEAQPFYDYGAFIRKLELYSPRHWRKRQRKDQVVSSPMKPEYPSPESQCFVVEMCASLTHIRLCNCIGVIYLSVFEPLVRRYPLKYLDLCGVDVYAMTSKERSRPLPVVESLIKYHPQVELVGLFRWLRWCSEQSDLVSQHLHKVKKAMINMDIEDR
jgi:hypothetical protein